MRTKCLTVDGCGINLKRPAKRRTMANNLEEQRCYFNTSFNDKLLKHTLHIIHVIHILQKDLQIGISTIASFISKLKKLFEGQKGANIKILVMIKR